MSKRPDVRLVPAACEIEGDSVTDGDLHNRLLLLHQKAKSGLLEKIEADNLFGREWKKTKEHIKKIPGLTIKEWGIRFPLPFSMTWANGCERFTLEAETFPKAHAWYQQSGIADGWRVKRASGWEYGLEVVRLWRAHLRREAPSNGGRSPNPDGKHPKKDDLVALRKQMEVQKTKTSDVQACLLRAFRDDLKLVPLKLAEKKIVRGRKCRDLAISTTFDNERDNAFEQLRNMALAHNVDVASFLAAIR